MMNISCEMIFADFKHTEEKVADWKIGSLLHVLLNGNKLFTCKYSFKTIHHFLLISILTNVWEFMIMYYKYNKTLEQLHKQV